MSSPFKKTGKYLRLVFFNQLLKLLLQPHLTVYLLHPQLFFQLVEKVFDDGKLWTERRDEQNLLHSELLLELIYFESGLDVDWVHNHIIFEVRVCLLNLIQKSTYYSV